MIQKSEYFEQADMYINSEMTLPELEKFESQMAIDSALSNEVDLQKQVQQAVCEQDVINLRSKLNHIVQNQPDDFIHQNSNVNFTFDLTEDFTTGKELNQINIENLLNFGNSFPKIHLYQHKLAGKENIHQFYKEQVESSTEYNEEFEFSPLDEKLFAEIQSALGESDIAELRANLKQVALSVPAHKYSSEEIEDYIYNQMDTELKSRFEEELAVNPNLAQEMLLIKDIDLAIAENDILELRANLNKIQHTEIKQHKSIEDLEKYISNEFSFEEMAAFEAELSSNYKLQEEIDLMKNVDQALSETDVMQLRNNLQNIASQVDADKQKQRSFVGKSDLKRIISSATVAASIVLLLSFSGILSKQYSSDEIYQKFYTKYEIAGTVRSANLNENKTFALALQKYENKDYTEALNLFGQVISNDPNNVASHFYSGVSLQETGKYNMAIKEYETVIFNKDNLFTEQAEWYTGLCLLQTNENKKAHKQFKKIALSKGFYQQKATELLKKIKYTE